MYRYPTEIFSGLRKSKTLSVTSALFSADVNRGEKPLAIYGKFSRFPITIINTAEKPKKILKANIEINQLADMFFRTDFAYRKELEISFEKPAQGSAADSLQANLSPAYRVVLNMGNYKGMTPAQVLAKERNTAGLEKQRMFLAQNVERYPANAVQIQAIDDALRQFAAGTLSDQQTNSTGASGTKFELYSADMRPNMFKQRSDGKHPVTSFHIYWLFGNKYPVQIEIGMYYAPVQKLNDGRLNVIAAGKSDYIAENYLLSAAEWLNCLSMIKKNMKQFEMITAKKLFEDSRKAEEANRQDAKNKPQDQNYPEMPGAAGAAGNMQPAMQQPTYTYPMGTVNGFPQQTNPQLSGGIPAQPIYYQQNAPWN